MMLEMQEHHIAEIRDKIEQWPASKLNAADVRDDCRKLLEHIEAREQRYTEENERRDDLASYNCNGCYERGLEEGRAEAEETVKRLTKTVEDLSKQLGLA